MERPRLAERLRGILKAPPPRQAPSGRDGVADPALAPVSGGFTPERVLGGDWCNAGHGVCFVVERAVEAGRLHGRTRVGDLGESLDRTADAASVLAGGAPGRPPFVFFDLETTGLSGGAGTYAFLVGFGSFDERRSFVTRQYVMTRHSDERALLATVADCLTEAGSLVSFNGKSFDAPVLETRFLFHRLEWAGMELPHFDVLHPARRFWSDAGLKPEADGGVVRNACSLNVLERQVLGVHRHGDVSGFDVPARYFHFVRSGDARPLAAVLEHNRLDLLSLAALTARLLHLVSTGSRAALDAREALALGRVYARAGRDACAREAYERALAWCGSGVPRPVAEGDAFVMGDVAPVTTGAAGSAAAVRIAALRALALASRRARRYEESASLWRQLLAVDGCPCHLAREATEALAIHHEHRVRDLAAARTFALRSLADGLSRARAESVRHRLARIDRKLAGKAAIGGRLELSD